MRIQVCAKHIKGTGGQEGFLKRLCAFLVSRGHTVDITTTEADDIDGTTVTHVSTPWRFNRSVRDWAMARAVAAKLQKQTYDVSLGGQKTWGCNVIRPGGGVEAEYWDIRLSDRYDWAPLRMLAQTASIKRRFDLDAERRGYCNPALRYVIANSELVRQCLLRRYPTLQDKIHVVYNGANRARFSAENDETSRAATHKALGLDPACCTAIFAAHNFRLKGLAQAIQAVDVAQRQSGKQSFQLIVVGGDRPTRMRELAHRLGLEHAVRFVGGVSDPGPYYAASDVLLFPSFYDPCANVTFEALASGIPVISTKRNGASEVISDGNEGWTVERPDCIEEMAFHLNALQDSARLADMKAAARVLAAKHTTMSKLTEIESILEAASRLR